MPGDAQHHVRRPGDPPIEHGLGHKPLTWRIGAWLVTLALALALLGRYTLAVVAAVVALVVSFQYAHVRMRGRTFVDDQGPVVEKLGVISFLLHLVLWRAPVLVGDIVLTPIWNTVARVFIGEERARHVVLDAAHHHPHHHPHHGRDEHDHAPRRSVVVPPTGEDEATWPPEGHEGTPAWAHDWSLAGTRAPFAAPTSTPRRARRSWGKRILRGHW